MNGSNSPKNARSKRGNALGKTTMFGIMVGVVVCAVGYAAATHKEEMQQLKDTAQGWIAYFIPSRSEGVVVTATS